MKMSSHRPRVLVVLLPMMSMISRTRSCSNSWKWGMKRLPPIPTSETILTPISTGCRRVFSYQLDVNLDKAEDVLLHRRILTEAKDLNKRPVFHVRFMKLDDSNLDTRKSAEEVKDGSYLTEALSIRRDSVYISIHEIIFSTLDKPKLLSQFSESVFFCLFF